MVSSQQDQLIWPTIVGKCTIKEATRYLYEIKDTTVGPSEWNWIWKIPCVYKIQIFIWKCCHNRLPDPFKQISSMILILLVLNAVMLKQPHMLLEIVLGIKNSA